MALAYIQVLQLMLPISLYTQLRYNHLFSQSPLAQLQSFLLEQIQQYHEYHLCDKQLVIGSDNSQNYTSDIAYQINTQIIG